VILSDVSFSFWYDDDGNWIGRGVQQAEYFHNPIIHPVGAHNSGCRAETQMSGNQTLGGTSNGDIISKSESQWTGRSSRNQVSWRLAWWRVAWEIAFIAKVSVTMPSSRAQLPLREKVERLGVEWNAAADKAGNLFEPVANVHPMNAPLVAIVEHGAMILTHTYTYTTRGS
jgi:hypothetical protein